MFNGTKSEHLPKSGHEEDEAEDCSGDKEGPGAVGLTSQQLSFPYTLHLIPGTCLARRSIDLRYFACRGALLLLDDLELHLVALAKGGTLGDL